MPVAPETARLLAPSVKLDQFGAFGFPNTSLTSHFNQVNDTPPDIDPAERLTVALPSQHEAENHSNTALPMREIDSKNDESAAPNWVSSATSCFEMVYTQFWFFRTLCEIMRAKVVQDGICGPRSCFRSTIRNYCRKSNISRSFSSLPMPAIDTISIMNSHPHRAI